MDAATRTLRVLAVAEWVFALAMGVASLWLWDTLPPALRDWEGPAELETPWALAIGMLLLPLGLASSIGVFLLWRPARTLFAATSAVGLAITPFFGPSVEPAGVSLFFQLGTLANGAILALLYLSPAARHFGTAAQERDAAGARPPRLAGAALFAAGVAAGVLVALGVLAAGVAGAGFGMFRAYERADQDGRAFGAANTHAACADEARRRMRDAGTFYSFSGLSFVEACLAAAQASEGFCDEVPASDAPAAGAWREARCAGDDHYDDCVLVATAVQDHCHPAVEPVP
jgi:hypothetical protein